MNWCLTGSPQHLALGVHAGTDASVAEGGFVLAGFSVLQEDVGRAVRGGAGAELREVALSERLATHGARRTQLRGEELNLIRWCVCVRACYKGVCMINPAPLSSRSIVFCPGRLDYSPGKARTSIRSSMPWHYCNTSGLLCGD